MRFLEGRPAWVAGMLMVALLVAGLSAAVLAQTDPAPPEPAAADEAETGAPDVPGAGTEIWQPEVTAEPDPAAD
ncbi:MAG: hypothetical protein GF320_15760, partial [Armatimonadia bacterium]|nr:hypothetical protein [Armatimonadia bacterium]